MSSPLKINFLGGKFRELVADTQLMNERLEIRGGITIELENSSRKIEQVKIIFAIQIKKNLRKFFVIQGVG